MIDLKEKTLMAFLYHVKEAAAETNEKKVYSWTKEIEAVDEIHLFEQFNMLNKNRFFWSNNNNDFKLVGAGALLNIINEDGNLTALQSKWESVKEEAFIYNPYELPGTGMTAIGGMAFDPEARKSDLWTHYPASQLTVPEYLVSYTKGKYFLTVNGYITKDSMIADVLEDINRVEAGLFQIDMGTTRIPQKVLHKHVIHPDKWKQTVEKAVNEIKQEKAQKIVLAREIRIKLNKTAHLSGMLKRLMETQPNSYVFAFEQADDCFLGATPERLVQVENDRLLSTCLAGTAPRGETDEADEQLANDLLRDSKNLEEHAYVVQMIKNNIEQYCSEINIPAEPVIYPLRNLQHLYTPVTATLKEHVTVFDLVKSLHPTP